MSTARPPLARTVRETIIIADDSDAVDESFTISPDNRRVAFVTKDRNRVVFDGHPQTTYDRIAYRLLCVSPDSRRLAYLVNLSGGKLALVVDGVTGKPYDSIGADGPVFSPDSQRIAYLAQEQGKWFVVVDGEERERYDRFGRYALTFSPDSQRLAYTAVVGKKFVMVVDGARGKFYDGIWPPVFSPDSRRVAYFATRERGVVAVVDEREHGPYADFLPDSLSFSPDSHRVAYVVKVPPPNGWTFSVGDPNKWVAVVDGAAGPPYYGIMPPVFSPNGRHVAYGAMRLKAGIRIPPIYDESVVVMDGQEGPPWDGIGQNEPFVPIDNFMVCRPPWPPCQGPSGPIFSPDNRIVYKAWMGPKLSLVVDGVPGRQYDELEAGPPAISSDGKRIAYAARARDKFVVVIDGAESGPYDGIEGTPVFSPDGTRVAYDALVGKRMMVVVDGAEWPQNYENSKRGTPLFSPDGRHVLSAVFQGGPTSAAVVVDGQAGDRYDDVLPLYARIVFDSARSFHYLARRGTSWVLVEETLD